MTNEVSIVLRVNNAEATKLTSVVSEVTRQNKILEKDAEKRLQQSIKLSAAVDKEAASYGGSGKAAQSAATFIRAEVEQREQSLLTIQNSNVARLAEARATEDTQRRMRAEMAATFTEEKRLAANRAALQAFKLKTIGENIDAEIVAQARLDRLHAAALAEDIAREKARTAAVIREREKAAAAQAALGKNFATGVASYAGVGAGANALGGGLAVAAGVYFASKTSIEFERAQKAIEAATGSMSKARLEMGFVQQQAQRLGVDVTTLAGQWAQFEAASKGTSLEGEKARDIFLAVTEAAQKLNLRSEETEGALRAISQMMSKGKVQAEELRGQLGDRLPGAFNIMSRAMGVTNAQLDKMMKNGGVATDDVLPAFAAELRKTVNTDVNTQIETTTANFTRLLNEIKLTAAAVGDELNPALSYSAGKLSDIIRYAREHPFQALIAGMPGGTALFGAVAEHGGATLREQDRAATARAAAYAHVVNAAPEYGAFNGVPSLDDLLSRKTPFYSPGLAGYGSDITGGLSGVDLLSSGPNVTTESERKKILALERQRLAVGKELTQQQQLQQLLDDGAYADETKRQIEARKALAVAQDTYDAKQKAAKLDKKDTRDTAREADAIRDQLARNDALRLELATGIEVTDGQKRLFDLKEKTADVSKRTLAAELATGDALEKQLDAQRKISKEREKDLKRELDAEEDARKAHARNVGEAIRYLGQRRRGGGVHDTYAQIDSREQASVGGENTQHASDIADAKASNAGLEDYEKLYAAHEARLTEIKDRAEQERNDLTRRYLDAGKTALGDAAEFAQAMGKKGFEAYKALSIAQTVISTYESAQKAYNSLADIPYVGVALGVAAAAATVAAGLARVSAIKSQTYGGGREMGGPVSADKFYEVGEKGKPEIVQSGGRYYLFESEGKVAPARQGSSAANGSNGGVRVTVHNYAGADVQTRTMSDGEIVMLVRQARQSAVKDARSAVAGDIGNIGSPASRNLQRVHQTRTKATR